jgi:SNF2 family DNA or RNA helicase
MHLVKVFMPKTHTDTEQRVSSKTSESPPEPLYPIRSGPYVRGFRKGDQKFEASPLWLEEQISLGYVPDPFISRWIGEQAHLRSRIEDIYLDTSLIETEPPLRDYQCTGVRILQTCRRILLSDVTGAGKTPQALVSARLEHANRVLVVAPKFLIAKWVRECHTWYPEAQVISLELARDRKKPLEDPPGPCIYIINWEGLSTDIGKELIRRKWNWFIGDEAHMIRNRNSRRKKAASQIRSEGTVLITATPFDASVDEVWALLNVLDPDQFSSYWRFATQFCTFKTVKTPTGLREVISGINGDQLPYFFDLIAPFYIRRTRSELGMQEPFEVPILTKMSPLQRDLYDRVVDEILLELPSGDLVIPSQIARITRLRQVNVCPFVLDDQLEESSSKIDALVQFAQTFDTEAIVVFTSFKRGVEAAHRALTRAGISSGYFHGDTHNANDVVERFKAGKFRVLITTPQSGGLGHDLERAHMLVFIDRPWSRLLIDQITGRLVRKAQESVVGVFSIINEGSIDDDVELLYSDKSAAFSEAIVASSVLRGIFEKSGHKKAG